MSIKSQLKIRMVFFGFLKKRIIHIPIEGIINQNKAFKIYTGLNKVQSYNVQAVFVSINSVMGSLVQTNNILEAIRTFTNKTGKRIPFYVFAEDYCFNSANLLLAGADKAYANKFSLLGDIGYVEATLGVQNILKNNNIRIETIGGSEKDKISPVHTLTKDNQEWIRKRLIGLTIDLKQRILEKKPSVKIENQIAVFSSRRGKQIGLIDQIQTIDAVRQTYFKDVKIQQISTKQTGILSYGRV